MVDAFSEKKLLAYNHRHAQVYKTLTVRKCVNQK
jgi:hypothetical protein